MIQTKSISLILTLLLLAISGHLKASEQALQDILDRGEDLVLEKGKLFQIHGRLLRQKRQDLLDCSIEREV